MQKLLFKWRTWKIDIPLDYGNFTLGGKPDGYTLSFRYNASRQWYVENCKVNIKDQLVQDYVDIGKVSGLPRKDKLFGVIEFDETKISPEDLAFDLTHDYPDYGIRVINNTEAAEFLRDFTNCSENNGTFTLLEEQIDTLTGVVTPAYTLTL